MIELLLLWMLQNTIPPKAVVADDPYVFSNGIATYRMEPVESIRVLEPAIRVKHVIPDSHCVAAVDWNLEPCREMIWTCADKSRILLTSEDKQHYCLTMEVFK